MAAFLDNPARVLALICLVVPIVALGLVMGRAGMASLSAQARERAAGYTTLYGRKHADLWQLDPKTGEVVRRPGDPPVLRNDRSKSR